MVEVLKCGLKSYKDIRLLNGSFTKIHNVLQKSRFLHARTSARELNLINRFCQLINFALNPHARGQRAAADHTPRHCQFQVRGHYFDYFHDSSGNEKKFMLS